MKFYNIKKIGYLIFTLTITTAIASECPEGSEKKHIRVPNPFTKNIIEFNCENLTRREFIKTNEIT